MDDRIIEESNFGKEYLTEDEKKLFEKIRISYIN